MAIVKVLILILGQSILCAGAIPETIRVKVRLTDEDQPLASGNGYSFMNRQNDLGSFGPVDNGPWSTAFKDESFCPTKCNDQWVQVPDLAMTKPFEFSPQVSLRDKLLLTRNLMTDLSPSPTTKMDWASTFDKLETVFDGSPNCCGEGNGHVCGTRVVPEQDPAGTFVVCRLVGKCGGWTIMAPEFTTYNYGPDPETNCKETPNPVCGWNYCNGPEPPQELNIPPSLDVPAPCNYPMTLMVVLDSSGSVEASNYEIAKGFVANLSTAFTTVPGSRFGMVVFGHDAQVEIPINNQLTPQEIQNQILETEFLDESTATHLGLKLAIEELEDAGGSDAKVLLTITDGDSNIKSETSKQAATAATKGYHLYVVRITAKGKTDPAEVLALAGGDENRITSLTGFVQLSSIMKDLSSSLCKNF